MDHRVRRRIISDNKKHQEAVPADVQNGLSISGSTPDLESDDNVLDTAHEAGVYEQADEEHPAESNIAEEVERDEKYHQKND